MTSDIFTLTCDPCLCVFFRKKIIVLNANGLLNAYSKLSKCRHPNTCKRFSSQSGPTLECAFKKPFKFDAIFFSTKNHRQGLPNQIENIEHYWVEKGQFYSTDIITEPMIIIT